MNGHPTGKGSERKEHPAHRDMKAKAVAKISSHASTADRVRTFLEDEVENFETLLSATKRPGVTLAQAQAELRLAIDDRKADIEEIVALLTEHA